MFCYYDTSLIKSDKLDLVVVSMGGCASNSLVRCLEKNGLTVRSPLWDKILCHCPSPPVDALDIPFIYVYRNIRDAFISQKSRGRGFWDLNCMKLSNSVEVELSDKSLIKSMIKQYKNWTLAAKKFSNILVISYDELFTPRGKERIENFIGKPLKHYINYKRVPNNFKISKETKSYLKAINIIRETTAEMPSRV